MTPAAAIYEKLKNDIAVSAITVAHWIVYAPPPSGTQPAEAIFTIIQFAESLEYRTVDGIGTTRATITVNCCGTEYDRAWELAEAVRLALHNASDVANARYSFSVISFESLANAIVDGQGQQNIYIIPQVFTCHLRRL